MSWQNCMSFSKCSNLEAKNVKHFKKGGKRSLAPVDISPEPVGGF